MDTNKYIEVMISHLLPQAAQWYPCGDWIYQQDGARCHTSRKSIEFFQENSVELLPWCPNTPDMNPMENVWELLKNRVYSKTARNKVELIQNIREVASNIGM